MIHHYYFKRINDWEREREREREKVCFVCVFHLLSSDSKVPTVACTLGWFRGWVLRVLISLASWFLSLSLSLFRQKNIEQRKNLPMWLYFRWFERFSSCLCVSFSLSLSPEKSGNSHPFFMPFATNLLLLDQFWGSLLEQGNYKLMNVVEGKRVSAEKMFALQFCRLVLFPILFRITCAMK